MDQNFDFVNSGMVAIVGPPNAGKSTLMNRLLGQKISIVTAKPQTTRNRIAGIVSGKDHQVVFLDTPGLHTTRDPLNVQMVKEALDCLPEVDLVLFMVDVTLPVAAKKMQQREEDYKNWLTKVDSPAFLLLNKIDLVAHQKLLPLIKGYSELYPFAAVFPISGKKGEGTQELLNQIITRLPKGPKYFPDDIPTDASERFLCGEIIREKVFLHTGQEIPYQTAVLIDSFKEAEEKKRVTIHATVVVDRDSQKGIIIGKKGSRLKKIGIESRIDMEKLLGIKVDLRLWVKVKKNWAKDKSFLRELGL